MNEPGQARNQRTRGAFLLTVLVVLVYCIVGLTGIQWGLPSQKRSDLYDAPYEEVVGSGTGRLFVTGPLQSYQVDECSALMPLARMRPRELNLNPQWFHWGSLHLYATGAVLLLAKNAGIVTLTTEKGFYLEHPEEMARIYLVARLVVWGFGLGCVLLMKGLLRRVIQRSELVVLLLLLFVLAPLFGLYSHFATPDVPLLFWILAASVLAGVGTSHVRNKGVLLGSFCAVGLAASTKFYGGLALVFPVWYTFRRSNPIKLLMIGLFLSVCGFLIGTPYALLDWKRFLTDLAWQWNHVEHGHGDAFLGTPPSFLYHWVESLPAGLAPATTIVVALGVLWIVFNRERRRLLLPVLVFLLLFWIQVARSPLKFSRYLLPTIPFHFIFVGALLQDFWERRQTQVLVAIVVTLLLGSAGVLTATHLRILTRTDVRDAAGAWLAHVGEPGDTIFFPGRPYFASPPVSSRKFTIVTEPLTPESLKAVRPDWIILTDYDLEPGKRAPDERPGLINAWRLLERTSTAPAEISYRRHTFSAHYDPPIWACWGQRFLPHDLRYHCPEIWLFENTS